MTHFGTLQLRPIQVRVLTNEPTELPEDYDRAEATFDHVRARLVRFTQEMSRELGNDWHVMVEEVD